MARKIVNRHSDVNGVAERQWKIVARRFRRDKIAMTGIGFLGIITMVCLVQTTLNPDGWNTLTLEFGQPPSWRHLFGTTDSGLDLFSGCLRGALQDLVIALVVSTMSMVIGTFVGALAGYFGGKLDTILMRVVDLLLVVPLLTVLIAMSHWLVGRGNAPMFVALIIGALSWTYIARLVRAEFLALRERTFVEASKALGAGHWRIITRHLIPNAIGTILVNTTLTISGAILVESTLSYLGLGIVPPAVSLGMLVQQGQQSATTSPWLFAFPAGLLLLIILCVFAVGDGLQGALDPRKARGRG
jgi:peptide/nickel transport system permease protein